MSNIYKKYPAVGQYDENSCWAACLEWWNRSMNLVSMTQEDVFNDYMLLRGDGGSLSMNGIIQIIEDPRWSMKWYAYYAGHAFTADRVKSLLASGPIYVGYWSNKLQSNHVNVIYGVSGSGSHATVNVMEPHAVPIAGDDPGYYGRHKVRKLSLYTTGEVHVGVLKGYASSGTGYDESYYY